MFQPNRKSAFAPAARVIEIARTLVILREEREGATIDDLIGSGFTRAEIEVYRDAAIAEAGRRWALRQAVTDSAGSRRLKRAS